MMIVLRYGMGMPLHRLEIMQRFLGVPVPASTQWEVTRSRAGGHSPSMMSSSLLAANAPLVHNDDTYVRILEAPWGNAGTGSSPPAISTSPIAPGSSRRGSWHAPPRGRSRSSPPDASTPARPRRPARQTRPCPRSTDADIATGSLATCPRSTPSCSPSTSPTAAAMSSTRVGNHPEALRAPARRDRQGLHERREVPARAASPARRASLYISAESGPVMDGLRAWIEDIFANKRVEPNSGLGGALRYLLVRWDALTLFLRAADAPLDNNISERSLKQRDPPKATRLVLLPLEERRSRRRRLHGAHRRTQLHRGDPFRYLATLFTNYSRPWRPRRRTGCRGTTRTRSRASTNDTPRHPCPAPRASGARANFLNEARGARRRGTAAIATNASAKLRAPRRERWCWACRADAGHRRDQGDRGTTRPARPRARWRGLPGPWRQRSGIGGAPSPRMVPSARRPPPALAPAGTGERSGPSRARAATSTESGESDESRRRPQRASDALGVETGCAAFDVRKPPPDGQGLALQDPGAVGVVGADHDRVAAEVGTWASRGFSGMTRQREHAAVLRR